MTGKLTREGKEKIRQELLKKGLEFESLWKQEVPVFTVRYKNSIEAEAVDWNRVIVGTNVEYAKALEFGLGEGNFPPVDELRKWVRRKLPVEDDEVDSVAYLVGRSIEESGVNKNASLQRAVRKFKSKQ